MLSTNGTDYIGNPFSSVVDLLSTTVMGGRMVKVMSWYDNEWGYSSRCVDLALYMGARMGASEKKLQAVG